MKIQALIELDIEHECLQDEVETTKEILVDNHILDNIAGFVSTFMEDMMPRTGTMMDIIVDDPSKARVEIGSITFTSSE